LELKNAAQGVFEFVQNVPPELNFLNCSGAMAFPTFGVFARVLRGTPDWIDPPGIEIARGGRTG
jgi:hypothetical protein